MINENNLGTMYQEYWEYQNQKRKLGELLDEVKQLRKNIQEYESKNSDVKIKAIEKTCQ